MNTEGLAQRVADGQQVDWDSLDHSDPVVSGLHKISKYLHHLTTEPVSPPAAASRCGEWGNLLLIETIGKGSFGEVYRALDPVLQRDVALKVITDPEHCMLDAEDFISEAQRLAQVRHRNVMAVYGAAYFQDEVGFWSELLLGQTLERALQSGQQFAWNEALAIMRDLTEALFAVHDSGLIHGDIKAANVMLEPERGAVLLDFGAGTADTDTSIRSPVGLVQGTPLAMAPELLEGGVASKASDIYALGILFYRIMAGKYPFDAKDFGELRIASASGAIVDRSTFPEVPKSFRTLLGKMLAKDGKARPSAEELRHEIDWLTTLPKRRIRRIAYGTIAALLLGVAVASTVGYWFSSQAEQRMELARAETQTVNKVLTEMLASASPLNEGKDVRVIDVLSRAEVELQRGEHLSPQVKHEVLLTLASTYLALRDSERTVSILEGVLSELKEKADSPTKWEAMDLLALAYADQRDWPNAMAIAEESLELAHSIGSDADMMLNSEITLARSHLGQSEAAEAAARLESALASFPDAAGDTRGRAYLAAGNIYEVAGRFDLALADYQRAAELFYEAGGAFNANTISAKTAVGSTLGQQGRGTEAAALLREQLEIATDYLGLDHKTTYLIRLNLGAVLAEHGDVDGALEVNRSLYQSSQEAFGIDGLDTILVGGNIATMLVELGQSQEAESIYRDNIVRLARHHPEEHNFLLIQKFNLAELLNTLGRYDESKALATDALKSAETHLGEISIVGMELFESIARSNLGLGNAQLASEQLGVSVQTKSEHLGETHPLTLNAILRQGDALLAMGKTEDARDLFNLALEGRTQVFGQDHSATREVETRLSKL